MNQSEIKTKIPCLEFWHSEDDKNILLVTPDDAILTTQKAIIQPYLKKIKENIATHELDGQTRERLKASYKVALEKARILISKKGDVLKKKLPDDVILNDEKYFESDGKGNTYVSDDS